MQHDPFQQTFEDMFQATRPAPGPSAGSQQPSTGCNDTPMGTVETRLSRDQVIDRIVRINTSATASFLEKFETASLKRYLDHLDVAKGPRGRRSGWIRPGDSRAIMTYESQD